MPLNASKTAGSHCDRPEASSQPGLPKPLICLLIARSGKGSGGGVGGCSWSGLTLTDQAFAELPVRQRVRMLRRRVRCEECHCLVDRNHHRCHCMRGGWLSKDRAARMQAETGRCYHCSVLLGPSVRACSDEQCRLLRTGLGREGAGDTNRLPGLGILMRNQT